MILTPIILEDIEHIQKVNKSHERAFESIIDKVYREDKEYKEKAENDRKKKETILHKRELEKRKAEETKRAEELKRRDAENRARRETEQRSTAEEVLSSNNDRSRGEGEPIQASGVIGSTWAEVSPEQASQYMAQGTGVSADVWAGVIYHESSNNPTIVNEIGCFGYLQLHPVHGPSSTWTPQQYLDKAIEIYNTAGAGSWEAW
ncbi:putative lytic transglycosylase [Lactococcus phage PLG-II]|nr:putative lytic transglycosylase [Lactococcus phage PLG-II]